MGSQDYKFWRKEHFDSLGISTNQIVIMAVLLVALLFGLVLSQTERTRIPDVSVDAKKKTVRELKEKVTEIESLWYSERSLAGRDKAVDLLLKINLNEAAEKDLIRLPGIGQVLAKRIIAYRIRNGRFKRQEELKRVKGIGEKKYDRIAPYIKIN